MNWTSSTHFIVLQICPLSEKSIITIEPGKRGGKPCIRGMRITVGDILGWLATGMTINEIIVDFPELEENDIYAVLSYAADKENKIFRIAG